MTPLVHATCFHKFRQTIETNGLAGTTPQKLRVFTQRVAAVLTYLILTMTMFGHVWMTMLTV